VGWEREREIVAGEREIVAGEREKGEKREENERTRASTRVRERQKETETEREREHEKTGNNEQFKVGCVQTLEAMCFLYKMYFYVNVSLPIK
jgi:hypothetical protein